WQRLCANGPGRRGREREAVAREWLLPGHRPRTQAGVPVCDACLRVRRHDLLSASRGSDNGPEPHDGPRLTWVERDRGDRVVLDLAGADAVCRELERGVRRATERDE